MRHDSLPACLDWMDPVTIGAFRRFDHKGQVSELTPGIAARLLAGVPPKVVADESGIGLRTAYRWRSELVAVQTVTVDGWTATFARRRRTPPVRISAWERVV